MTPPRVALITGAGEGLGRAIAERIGSTGAAVVATDVDASKAAASAEAIIAAGGTALPITLDVRDETAVVAAVEMVARKFGRLDILVNNAGIAGERNPIESYTVAGFELAMRTNLTSMFLTCRAAIPLMKRQHWGRIVNLASLVTRGQPGTNRTAYVASKFGIVGFSRALAEEVGRDGITVNCVAPSRIKTPLTIGTSSGAEDYWQRGAAGSVFNRLGEPNDIAHAVAFLASDRASFITGAVLDVNGGTSMR